MMQRYGWLLLWMCWAWPASAQDVLDGLEAYVEQAMAEWQAPGLAIAIVKDDAVVFAQGFGSRQAAAAQPTDAETVFLNASTTKAFTTAALAMLVDEEQLGWDDRVIDHLPTFRLADPYVTREMRIRDLVSHRSGLARSDYIWYASPMTRQDVMDRLPLMDTTFGFRAGYGYNNNMFIAAGAVIEAVSGLTWDAFMEQRILQPLGMARTSTSITALPADNRVTPHGRSLDGEVYPVKWRNYDNVGPAGSLNSTVTDMTQWIRLQLNEGEIDGQRLISAEQIREMHAAQTTIRVSESYKRDYPETNFRAYGLGWFLNDYRGHKVVQHSGSLDGMRARVGMIPELELGVVLFTNVNESTLLAGLMYHVFDRYIGASARDWNAHLLASRERSRAQARQVRAEQDSSRIAGTTPSRPLADFAGRYTDPVFGTAEVKQDGDALVLTIGPEFVGDLTHWHYDTFRATWRDRYMGRDMLTFRFDSSGEVEALAIDGWATFVRKK
ncbi:MAG: serine hydrolase [Bacteroidota bacterium]